ncbi:MAG: hypothetical protein GF307_11920 [candidate division Zixibacteria bacterium]|nr:hypothetical protein [candidate division Zixibacteria bacterium]
MLINDKGIYFKSVDLWMDSSRVKKYCYISHAHSDHTAKHKKILCTPETAALTCQRLGKLPSETVKYHQWLERDGYRLKLFPAGHILGSSQIMIETDDQRIVYAGDFRLGKSRTCPPAEVEECDVLLLETTYGLPHYIFPRRSTVEEQLIEYVNKVLAEGKIPVVMAYALGKAQEAIAILNSAGIRTTVHESVFKLARIYERFGARLGNYIKFRKGIIEGALIIPPHMRKFKNIEAIPDKVFIMLTGWGADPAISRRYGADKLFPVSDHSDFNGLMEYIRKARPGKIFTIHGFDEFASHLRKYGYDAEPMVPGKQYELAPKDSTAVNLELFD